MYPIYSLTFALACNCIQRITRTTFFTVHANEKKRLYGFVELFQK